MTIKFSVINIYNLIILILQIVKVDFDKNTGNTFFGSIKNVISENLDLSNSTHNRRWDHNIVIGSNFSKISIFY